MDDSTTEQVPLEPTLTNDNPPNVVTKTQVNENKGKIDQQFIVQNLNINQVTGESQREPDPSEEYPYKNGIWYPDEKEIEKCAHLLFENRLIVTSCTNKDALECLTISLMERDEFFGLNRRLLGVDDTQNIEDKKRSDASFEISRLNESLKKSIQSLSDVLSKEIKHNTFYIIDVESKFFLDTLFHSNENHIKRYQERLSRRKIFILCRIDSDELIKYIQEKKGNTTFPTINISRLHFMLRQNGFDEAKTIYYEKNLKEQNKSKLWGNVSEKNFTDMIYKLLLESEVKFIEEFNKRSALIGKSSEEIEIFLKNRLGKLYPKDFISMEEPMSLHLAFAGTYFPSLTVREFQDLVFVLLSDEKKIIKEIIKKEIKNEDKTIEIKEEIIITKCFDTWTEQKDYFLKKTKLKLVRTDSKTEGVDFSEPYLREEVQDYIEREFPFYFQSQIDFLFNVGVLFSDEVSDNIVKNLLKLFARMAVKDPQIYGLKKLKELTELINQVSHQIDEQAEGYDLLIEIFKKMRADGIRGLAYFRLYQLIEEFLNTDLSKVVEEYINYLFDETQHDIILNIIFHLRNATNFNKFYWVKQMFDKYDKEEELSIENGTYKSDEEKDKIIKFKYKTYELVVELASKANASQSFEYLKEVKKWLPIPNKLHKDYTSANKFALAFIVDFSIKAIQELPEEEYGQWFPTYLLFSNITGENNSDTEGWSNLVEWLFNPNLYKSSNFSIEITKIIEAINEENNIDDFSITQENQDFIIRNILLYWYFILHGWQETTQSNNEKAINSLLLTVQKIAGNKRLKDIAFSLGQLADNYLTIFADIPITQKKERERLKKQRAITKKMINHIREIIKTGTK